MILLVLLLVIAGGLGIWVVSDPSTDQALTLDAAAYNINKYYVDTVNWDELVESGRSEMFSKLDRYSTYFPKTNFEDLDQEFTGGYSGIGVSILYEDTALLIMSVREDGPAAEVGLMSGDLITAVDSVEVDTISSTRALNLLRGAEGSQVRVQIHRPSTDDSFEVSITRRRMLFIHVPYAGITPDSNLYIRLLDFDFGASADVRAALDSLLPSDGTRPRPKGIILDLRGNPGGLFSEAYTTADLFLKKGVFVVGTLGRSRWNDERHISTHDDMTGGLPMGIIVDRGSASAAEIVSGSLQQAGRAFLVGDTTFGKGLVQGFVRFPGGDGLKLTISRYYFEGPNGRIFLNDLDSTLHDVGHGLIPNYYFDLYHTGSFLRELENSLLIQQYGALHQDSLIAATKNGDSLSDRWLDSFRDYARKQGARLKSQRTLLVDALREEAEDAKVPHGDLQLLDRMANRSSSLDDNLFSEYGGYIKFRLLQAAYERKYGAYDAYKDVVVKMRPEIAYTSKLLREQHQ